MVVQPQTNYAEVQAVGDWIGKGLIHQMKNICAGETTPGSVIMRVVIFTLIGVVFHGHMAWGYTLSPPSKEQYYYP
jgi:hypothetical protein